MNNNTDSNSAQPTGQRVTGNYGVTTNSTHQSGGEEKFPITVRSSIPHIDSSSSSYDPDLLESMTIRSFFFSSSELLIVTINSYSKFSKTLAFIMSLLGSQMGHHLPFIIRKLWKNK